MNVVQIDLDDKLFGDLKNYKAKKARLAELQTVVDNFAVEDEEIRTRRKPIRSEYNQLLVEIQHSTLPKTVLDLINQHI